jgi:hypothetical protein
MVVTERNKNFKPWLLCNFEIFMAKREKQVCFHG